MKHKLQHYVGRIVRVNSTLFDEIKQRAQRQGLILENAFLVASVSLQIKKLICYGNRYRIVVDASDVVLV